MALLAPPPEAAVRITEKEILENKDLMRKIKDYYYNNVVDEIRWYGGRPELDDIYEMRVMDISGNRARLDVRYRASAGGHNTWPGRAIVTIEKTGSTFRVLDMRPWQGN